MLKAAQPVFVLGLYRESQATNVCAEKSIYPSSSCQTRRNCLALAEQKHNFSLISFCVYNFRVRRRRRRRHTSHTLHRATQKKSLLLTHPLGCRFAVTNIYCVRFFSFFLLLLRTTNRCICTIYFTHQHRRRNMFGMCSRCRRRRRRRFVERQLNRTVAGESSAKNVLITLCRRENHSLTHHRESVAQASQNKASGINYIIAPQHLNTVRARASLAQMSARNIQFKFAQVVFIDTLIGAAPHL